MSTPDDEAIRVGGRYRLDERIGAGAMGAVWRGTDELLNRTVAVKELLAAAAPHTAAGVDALEESRQRILREGRIGARLQHPHVISMFDVVVHEDRPWLVMEYLPSKSLAEVLSEKGPLPPREVADIGRQVADGLAAAHVAGVTHRDVKPGNVLLAEDGRVKLTDFGVSRAVDDVQLTRTGLIAGTPAYLSPEVARGQDPAAASDVFALGATLYAAVEGVPPFGLDENAYALLHKVATGEINPPEQAGPLTGVLLRLLSADPAARPSATQARDALAAVAAVKDAPAPPPPVSGPPTLVALASAAPSGTSDAPARAAAAPPAPAAAAPGASGAAGRPGRRRGPLLLAVLAAVLIGGGVVAFLVSGGTGDAPGTGAAAPPTTSAAPTTTSAPAAAPPATSAAPTTTPEPTTTTAAPVPTAPAAPPAGGTDPVAFVQNYYGLLPGNTEAAWALLSPTAQSQSGGRANFDRFYAGMTSVTLEDVRQVDATTVDATIVFRETNGRVSRDPYRFVMAADGSVMQSFDQR